MSDREKDGGPPGWKRMTLGEALPIRYGKARNEKYGTVREDTPVYGSSGRIDTFDRALTGGPSLIIGRKGTVGATYYCPEPCWPIDTVYFTEAPADEDLRFFKYLLDHLQLARMDRSTAVPGLSRDDYNATDVFIPELDQQRLIVAEIEKQFSRLDEAVANLKRVKANLKRYKTSVLKAAVEGKLTEEWRKQHPNVEPASKLLERILAERRAKWNGRGKYKEPAKPDTSNLSPLPKHWIYVPVDMFLIEPMCNGISVKGSMTPPGVPALRLNAMTETGFDYSKVRYIPIDAALAKELEVKTGDFFVSRGNGSLRLVGRGTVAQVPPCQCVFPDTMIRLRIAVAMETSRWISTIWSAELIRRQIEKRVKTTAGIWKISQPELGSILLPVPPEAEQHHIAAEVERHLSVIDELEAAVQANLARAERLRQSILEQAFSGKLLFNGARG